MPVQFVRSMKDFDGYLARNNFFVANFTAVWCPPCQAVKPVIDQLFADENGSYSKIGFARVDLDSSPDIASRYRVASIPTFIFFEKGKETSRINGANIAEVVKRLDQMSSKASNDPPARRHGAQIPVTNRSPSLADNIRNIPPVTRFFTISTVIVCFANSLNLLQKEDLICYLPVLLDKASYAKAVINKGGQLKVITAVLSLILQCYRFFTAFLLPLGVFTDQPFQAILDIYFFYTFANHLESPMGKFKGNFPDCLWFTLVTGTIIVLMTLAYSVFDPSHFPIHHQMMVSCVTYLWSRSLKNSLINFLGIVPIRAYYLPLFNLFFKLMINGYSSFLDTFIGILGGYLYQCIQSNTLPIYNLYSGSYSSSLTATERSGRRVGINQISFDNNSSQDFINDSIFDKGYLKAPIWLYNLLNYPINTSKRTTAFDARPEVGSERVSPISGQLSGAGTNHSTVPLFGNNGSAFRGKGHRLGN
ncbi:uncharacterized protein PRCAT00003170001 [Priceomyces carsonii]|uniref:uncharacterized protein n=1 Tax=Priceomyces carsonii TaxID=28549 RepID=UPI002EDA8C3B|nr:unnamed protein product [Priceomyces carsonii]